MIEVTMILPKDRSILEKKYSEALAEQVAEMLTHDELGYLIEKLKEKEGYN
jgi:hypothetical protein